MQSENLNAPAVAVPLQIAHLKSGRGHGDLLPVESYLRLLAVTLFVPIFVAAGTTSFAADSSEKIEIKLTHTHHHDDQHQHDAVDHHAHSDVHDDHHAATPAKPHHDHQGSTDEHTHSIVVSCVHVYMTEPETYSVSMPREVSNSFAAPENLYPPRARALGSIFRPPIAA